MEFVTGTKVRLEFCIAASPQFPLPVDSIPVHGPVNRRWERYHRIQQTIGRTENCSHTPSDKPGKSGSILRVFPLCWARKYWPACFLRKVSLPAELARASRQA